jgi:hypothetical protein
MKTEDGIEIICTRYLENYKIDKDNVVTDFIIRFSDNTEKIESRYGKSNKK